EDRHRRERRLAELVLRKRLEVPAFSNDERHSVLVREVDLSVGRHGRSRELSTQALLIDRRAAERVEAREDAGVVRVVEESAEKDRRWNVRSSPDRAPGDMRLGDFALAAGFHGERRSIPSRARVDEAVPVDEGRNDLLRRPIGAPKLLARRGVEPDHPSMNAEDDLIAAVHPQRKHAAPTERRVELPLPDLLARSPIDPDGDRRALVVLLDEEDDLSGDRGRSASAVRAVEPWHRIMPKQRSREVVGNDAAIAEKRDHALAVDDGRRRGPAVLLDELLLERGCGRILHPEDLAGDRKRADDRAPPLLLERGREEDPIPPDHRRGVPTSGYGRLPFDVLLRTPLDRHPLLGR